jgi:hypothetical protein
MSPLEHFDEALDELASASASIRRSVDPDLADLIDWAIRRLHDEASTRRTWPRGWYPCRRCGQVAVEHTGGGRYYCEACEQRIGQIRRQEELERIRDRRAARVAAGLAVCEAVISAGGRLCGAIPIRGSSLCTAHSDRQARVARDMGRAYRDMALGPDELAAVTGSLTPAIRPIVIANAQPPDPHKFEWAR